MADDPQCYVARCKCGCGRPVFIVADNGDATAKRVASKVAGMIRNGYVIERMSVAEFRASKFGCVKRSETCKQMTFSAKPSPTPAS